MAGETTTFKQAYGVLQRHAETLRVQSEPNIDDLLSIVEESVAAYKVCKDRIDAVETALQAALTEVGEESASVRAAADAHGASSARQTPPPGARAAKPSAQAKSGFDDVDDDIPF
jgi:exodeoxyribonuclease VII small subunit